ncbi:MAG TPA: hypothetical protein V6C84_21385 [Coleofasciculaceae cyanobacterium]|jgi:hypothetical protein
MQLPGLNSGIRIFQAALGASFLTGLSIVLPAIAQEPTIFENVTLSPSFTPDPTTVRGISGGEMTANQVAERADTATGPCNGFVDAQPDHTIVLTEYFNYLSLQVQSPEDTTLVIRGPGGVWCNDDYSGKNPGITGKWLSGTYQVWIGSYQSNRYSPYVMRITELQ